MHWNCRYQYSHGFLLNSCAGLNAPVLISPATASSRSFSSMRRRKLDLSSFRPSIASQHDCSSPSVNRWGGNQTAVRAGRCRCAWHQPRSESGLRDRRRAFCLLMLHRPLPIGVHRAVSRPSGRSRQWGSAPGRQCSGPMVLANRG